MTTSILVRWVVGIALSVAMYIAVYRHEELETAPESVPNRQRYLPFLNNMFLLTLFPVLMVLLLLVGEDPQQVIHVVLSACFTIFSHISIFYPLLLVLLRRYLSARVCAALWLLPNYLYLLVTDNRLATAPGRPLLILDLPVLLVQIVVVVWLAGAALFFGWKIISHLRFRRQILADARTISDPAILTLWEQEQQAAGFKKRRYPLMISPATNTPLTMGFSRKSIRVLLPDKPYTMEETALILRHEIIHLGRDDCGTKLFLTFCTAMCWFNPLMWIAMRRSADDLELSCDESVLRDADERKRRQYAELLLTTAGDDRGFTSNLSNSAKALQYRLRQVMHPRKKSSGAVVIAVTFLILFITCGFVAIPYASASGADAIFQEYPAAECQLDSISWNGEYGAVGASTYRSVPVEHYLCLDEAAFSEYLSSLQLRRITGQFEYHDEAENILRLYYTTPNGALFLQLHEDLLVVQPLENGRLETYAYLLQEPMDFSYLRTLLEPEP